MASTRWRIAAVDARGVLARVSGVAVLDELAAAALRALDALSSKCLTMMVAAHRVAAAGES